jgi:hypothetical protein
LAIGNLQHRRIDFTLIFFKKDEIALQKYKSGFRIIAMTMPVKLPAVMSLLRATSITHRIHDFAREAAVQAGDSVAPRAVQGVVHVAEYLDVRSLRMA